MVSEKHSVERHTAKKMQAENLPAQKNRTPKRSVSS